MDSPVSSIKQGEYTIRVNQKPLSVTVIKMESTLLLWVGTVFDTSFHNLAVSMNCGFGDPSTTVVLSSRTEYEPSEHVEIDNNDISERLALFLSKKLNYLVYVSCAVTLSDIEETTLRSTLSERLPSFLAFPVCSQCHVISTAHLHEMTTG